MVNPFLMFNVLNEYLPKSLVNGYIKIGLAFSIQDIVPANVPIVLAHG